MEPRRIKILSLTAILVAAALIVAVVVILTSSASSASALVVQAASTSSQKVTVQDFQNAMRRLWEDHVIYTRLFIISDVENLPDKSATADRLLQNQVDIGNAIKPFYGSQAGDQLTALLKQHILIAVSVLDAAKAGDQATLQKASSDWYANASDIADFLSNANPKNWPLSTMQSLMKTHLDETLQEAVDRLHGNYAADIQDFDAVETHILVMADGLSAGIVAQFPNDFVK